MHKGLEVGPAARLVAASVALAVHEYQRLRLAGAAREGLEQGKNAGIGERDSQSYGSRNGEGDHKNC